jgi:hypothetical protein
MLAPAGLVLDIIGASILVVADIPRWRNDLASYCVRTRDVEDARTKLTTEAGGEQVIIMPDDPAYQPLIDIFEERSGYDIDETRIVSNWVGKDKYTIKPEGVKYRTLPARKGEVNNWIGSWYARYFRRLGLGVLILGFSLQLLAYFV